MPDPIHRPLPSIPSLQPDRRQASGRLAHLTAILLAAGLAAGFWIYQEYPVWQVKAVIGALLAGLALSAAAVRVARVGRSEQSMYWILPTLAAAPLVYGLLSGIGLLPGVLACLLFLASLSVFRPEKRRQNVLLTMLYALVLSALAQLPLSVRLDLDSSRSAGQAEILLLAVGAAALAWYAGSSLKLRSLSTRLNLAFVLFALLPVALLGMTLSVYNAGLIRERQLANLEVLAGLKQTEVLRWSDGLLQNLQVEVQDEETAQALETLFQAEAGSADYQSAYSLLSRRFQNFIAARQDFSHLLVLDKRGRVRLSSDLSQLNETLDEQDFFRQGLEGPTILPPDLSAENETVQFRVSIPVRATEGNVTGIVAATVDLVSLNRILASGFPPGSGIESYLINPEGRLVTPTRIPGFPAGSTRVSSPGAQATLTGQRLSEEIYDNYGGVPVIGVYRRLPELDSVLLVEQEAAVALQAVNALPWLAAGTGLLAVLIALGAADAFTGSFRNPLTELTAAVRSMRGGELYIQTNVRGEDEFGQLAQAFNTMTGQVSDRIAGLQWQVDSQQHAIESTDRIFAAATRVIEELAHLEQRAVKQRSVEPRTGQPQPLDQMQAWAVQLIASEMNLDYAALYWEINEQALSLRAAYHHPDLPDIFDQLPNQTSLTEIDVLPLLKGARSQINLALESRGHTENQTAVRGVLNLQSRTPEAFSGTTGQAFWLVSERLAVLFENARRSEEIYQTRQELEQIRGRYTRESWLELLRQRQLYPAYRYRAGEVSAISDMRPEAAEAWSKGRVIQRRLQGQAGGEQTALAVPVQLRDQVIGVLNLRFAQASIHPETVRLVEEASARLALVLENVRLLEAARQHAAREQMIGQATSRMREVLDVDMVMQTAVRELGQMLDLEEAIVELSLENSVKRANGG